MLIVCHQCKSQISDLAKRCPKCSAVPEVFLGPIVECGECAREYRIAYGDCVHCGAPGVAPPEAQPDEEQQLNKADPAAELATVPEIKLSAEKPKRRLDIFKGIFQFLIVAAVIVGFRYWNSNWRTSSNKFDFAQAEEILTESDQSDFFQLLKIKLPSDYEKIVNSLVVVVNDPKIADEDMFQAGYKITQAFAVENADFVFRAPDNALSALITESHSALIEASKVSPTLCAAFAKTDYPKVAGGLDSTIFSNASLLMLEAIVAGKSAPVDRPVASEEEWNLFLPIILSKLSAPTTNELSLSDGMNNISDGALCEFSLATMDVIDALPDEEAAYWYANMYRETAQMLP